MEYLDPRLHQLARAGDAEALMEALLDGEDPFQRDEACATAAHAAAGAGSLAALDVLLAVTDGRLAAATNRRGETPLHVAVHAGHAQVVRLLLAWAPGERQRRSYKGETPCSLAAAQARMAGAGSPAYALWRALTLS